MPAVQQHVVQGIQGGPCGNNPSGKTGLGQQGDPSGMVNVGMGQDHAGDLCRIHRKLPVFFIAFLPPALKHPAVHEYLIFSRIQKVHGACDFTGCTQKLTFHIHLIIRLFLRFRFSTTNFISSNMSEQHPLAQQYT
jgi:hypothetical protein